MVEAWLIALTPAAILVLSRLVPLLRGDGIRPFFVGAAFGLLIASAIGTRWSTIARLDITHSATLLMFTILGLSTMAWQTRKTPEGSLIATHRAAMLALIMSATALLLARPARLPSIAIYALVVASLQMLRPARASWFETATLAVLALLPIVLPAKFEPMNLDRVIAAFAAGSLVGVLIWSRRQEFPREWFLLAVGVVAGLVPPTLARLG